MGDDVSAEEKARRAAARDRRWLAALPMRPSLLAVSTFAALLGAVLVLPRLVGVDWFWDHARPVVAVFTGLWYLVVWVLAVRRGPASAPDLPADLAAAAARLRRRARWWRSRQVLGWLVVPGTAVVLVIGGRANADNQRLIDEQPRHRATVVGFSGFPLKRGGPDVVVDIDGRRATLFLGYPGDDEAQVGDEVEVVVDPDDPTYVISTASHDGWIWGPWGTVALGALLGGIGLYAAWKGVPPPAVVRAARRSREATHGSVQGEQDGSTLVWVHGAYWQLTVRQSALEELASGGWSPPPGTLLAVLGEVGEGQWVFVDDGRTRVPGLTLRPARPR